MAEDLVRDCHFFFEGLKYLYSTHYPGISLDTITSTCSGTSPSHIKGLSQLKTMAARECATEITSPWAVRDRAYRKIK
jgi:hypothetical protein